MPIPIRQRLPCPDPRFEILVTDDGSRTLIEPGGSVSYHSGCGAKAESEIVYLRHSGLAEKLAEPSERPLHLLEIGIGLGINAMLATAEARRCHRPLRYVGIENEPLSAEVLREIFADDTQYDANHLDRWLAHWDRFASGDATELRWTETGHAETHWIRQDALHWLRHRSLDDIATEVCDAETTANAKPFDIIFFDPFDPATNPELWTSDCFGMLRQIAADEAVLVTYCVKSSVRKAATEAGWTVTRRPGPPGGKREVMVAYAR